mmetsp:Transcript_31/g.80  ORF Transcript_31/g.80 Transcript_31/m.80 type:complete len:187 (+) Transcript_31:92-652(+)
MSTIGKMSNTALQYPYNRNSYEQNDLGISLNGKRRQPYQPCSSLSIRSVRPFLHHNLSENRSVQTFPMLSMKNYTNHAKRTKMNPNVTSITEDETMSNIYTSACFGTDNKVATMMETTNLSNSQLSNSNSSKDKKFQLKTRWICDGCGRILSDDGRQEAPWYGRLGGSSSTSNGCAHEERTMCYYA